MEYIRSTLASSASTGNDVNDLLRAIRVLLRLCEGRLAAHALLGPSPPAGSYRSLAADMNALHVLSGAIGEVATGLATSARRSLVESCAQLPANDAQGAAEQALRSDCEKTVEALDTAILTVRTVNDESIKQREIILETALVRDLTPELRAEIDSLINRIGDQLRGAPGAA